MTYPSALIGTPQSKKICAFAYAVFALLVVGIGVTSAAERPPLPPVAPPPAEISAPITLTVAPADSPLILHALLDSRGTSSASGSVRLLLSGTKTAALYMLASELQSDVPGVYIERGDVSIPGGTSLTGDLAHNLRVTVNNIPRPGTYGGKLTFFVPGQVRPALELRIEVQAHARPEVVPVRATVTRHLVSCTLRLSCFLATYILSDSVVSDEILIQLENKTREPVTVLRSALILRGEHTNIEVPHSVISPQPALPQTLPANQVTPLVFALQRRQLPSDRYQGSLRLVLQGSDEPVSINLDLAVRHGPLLPLCILILGIGVGRLVQKMDAPDVLKQMKMMERYQELSGSVSLVDNPGALQFIGRELTRVKSLIETGKDSEETLQLAIDKAAALVDLFYNIEQLERRAASAGDSLRAEITSAAEAARQLVFAGKFPQAEEQRQHMEALLSDGRMGGAESALPKFDGQRQLAVLQTAALAAADVAWRKVKAALSLVSGLSTRSADVRYWLMRPLLGVALLILLSLLGLQQLYVSAGTTFGATGLYDYLGLFVWGLSADIAQRSLHSLPGLAGR